MFSRNVRSPKRGAAGGSAGMTCDHLRPLLESYHVVHLLIVVVELFSKGQVSHYIVQIVKLGEMTALIQKHFGRDTGFW